MKKQSFFSRLYVGFILLFLYLPIFFVVAFSFNASKSNVRWTGFTFDWYLQMAADRDLKSALGISLLVAFSATLISVVLGVLGAVSLDKLSPMFQKLIYGLAYIPLIVPEIIMGIALLTFFSMLPIQYGIVTLVLSHTTFCIPYIFILTLIRLRGIDPAITEAARDLGAKNSQVFLTITLPLISPAIISGALLAVAMSLDDVIISFFVSGPTTTTLPVKIFSLLKLGVSPKINALCTVLLMLTFIVAEIVLNMSKKYQRRED